MKTKFVPALLIVIAGAYLWGYVPEILSQGGTKLVFRSHLVDSFPGGYKVGTADLNGDGKPDIIGLSTTPTALCWYENPSWKKHAITTKTSRNIDFACHDIDKDGRTDIALASEFDMRDTMHGGLVNWLRCPEDPTREWTLHKIGAEPSSHRLLWADVDGDDRMELIDAPIMGRGAQEPEWSGGVNLRYYEIPSPPDRGLWDETLIDNGFSVLHGISATDWNHDGRDDILTASFEGIHLLLSLQGATGAAWRKIRLGTGQVSEPPLKGASEVAMGVIAPDMIPYIASIEPWHGDKVVVYTPVVSDGALWRRTVIDSTFSQGHALITADIDGDGTDEIIAGYRGEGASLYVYASNDRSGISWNRIPLDEGDMATSGLCAADLDSDGDIDIIAIGTSTGNIKWYENLSISR